MSSSSSPSQEDKSIEADDSDMAASLVKPSLFSLYFYPNKEVKDYLADIKKRLDDITVLKPEIIYEIGLSDKITIEEDSEEEQARKTANYEGIYGYFKTFFSQTFDNTKQVKPGKEGEPEPDQDVDEEIDTILKELKEPICIYIIIKGLKIETVGGVRELENTLTQLKDFV